jgi:hypothetical protein
MWQAETEPPKLNKLYTTMTQSRQFFDATSDAVSHHNAQNPLYSGSLYKEIPSHISIMNEPGGPNLSINNGEAYT